MTVLTTLASDDPGDASETAQAVARLVRHLDTDSLEQLGQMLRSDLARLSPARDREANLGLLCELLTNGVDPTVENYEAARAQLAPEGEAWPSPSKLREVYRGRWLHVIRQAARVVEGGTAARVKSDHRGLSIAPVSQKAYTRDEVMWAVARCRRLLGHWPTEDEFAEWCRLERRLARVTGQQRQRTPVPKVVRNLFGSYSRLLQSTKRWDPVCGRDAT